MAIDLSQYCHRADEHNNLDMIKEDTNSKLDELYNAIGNLKIHIAHAKDEQEVTHALRQTMNSAKLVIDVCEDRLVKMKENI